MNLADREHSLVEICKEIEERFEITMEQVGVDNRAGVRYNLVGFAAKLWWSLEGRNQL